MRKSSEKSLTKRECKAAKGPNAAVMASLKNGQEVEVAGTKYIGTPAQYSMTEMGMVKVRKGVPYVRVQAT